ncbi:thiamine pyrophosphate-requiring protein [Arthrobacter sp. Marseille-P9274]|uniref:thiamine pyrophosphate-requiring protein n=1 Tax=Arthrobacter sp. Marseille-P9274 TaxID=2866572 RepID=UPI0021C99773|nr:thiamine pyrophosphate-requiring protein [Arthrobacter sp. Marseille-P9274]
MPQRTAADVMVERLEAWGVPRIFGYSGDGINTFMGALRRAGTVDFVQARHEENAAFMAAGHAKYTGTVGVVTSTQGPGAVHLLNGLYDAKLDGAPVVALVGQQSRSVLGSGYMQEIDLALLMRDVACYRQQVASAEALPMAMDRAFKAALTHRGPAVVIVPHDVQKLPAPDLGHEHGILVTSPDWRPMAAVPQAPDLQVAAEVLNAGRRVALLVGQGARGAERQVEAVAERLGAGIATSLLGKPFVDERLPYATGTMGHLGTGASGKLLGNCDTLLIIGSKDPWTEFYPPPGAARAVQIDANPAAIGIRYPVEAGLAGDADPTLRALLPLLSGTPDEVWQSEVRGWVEDWRRLSEDRAMTQASPINPERVLHELGRRFPEDARLAVDVGSCVYWYARQLVLPKGVQAHLSGTLASMGCSIPYGIAAKLDRPAAPVIAVSGDGALQMAGLAELITVARLWPQWADPRFVICVLNNRELAEVTWEQREMEGEPRFDASQAIPEFDYAGYARLLGLEGLRVDDPEKIGPAWEKALAAECPFLLEFVTDPEVPLLPPFPAGKDKAEAMQQALGEEGGSGRHASRMLERYVRQEEQA